MLRGPGGATFASGSRLATVLVHLNLRLFDRTQPENDSRSSLSMLESAVRVTRLLLRIVTP